MLRWRRACRRVSCKRWCQSARGVHACACRSRHWATHGTARRRPAIGPIRLWLRRGPACLLACLRPAPFALRPGAHPAPMGPDTAAVPLPSLCLAEFAAPAISQHRRCVRRLRARRGRAATALLPARMRRRRTGRLCVSLACPAAAPFECGWRRHVMQPRRANCGCSGSLCSPHWRVSSACLLCGHAVAP